MYADNRVAAIGLPYFFDPCLDLVVGLIPGDALPFVFPALARAFHGVLQAIGMVNRLVERQALDAQLAVRAGIERIALDALDFTIFRVEKDTA